MGPTHPSANGHIWNGMAYSVAGSDRVYTPAFTLHEWTLWGIPSRNSPE